LISLLFLFSTKFMRARYEGKAESPLRKKM
jgi:hypothetical protein